MRQFKCPLAWFKWRAGSPCSILFFSWGGSQREGEGGGSGEGGGGGGGIDPDAYQKFDITRNDTCFLMFFLANKLSALQVVRIEFHCFR